MVRKAKRLSLEELSPYLFEDAPRADPLAALPVIDFSQLFDNDNPVELEVGCGKGLFLLNAALASPSTNFLGIEIVRKYQLFTATRIALRKIPNVLVACGDGKAFLRDRVPARSLQTIHVYYPDPWWKTRHHKRRLFTAEFVELCVRSLQPGGGLSLATDVPEYFAVMLSLCRSHPRLSEAAPPETLEATHDLDYLTNFERKARKQGKPVFRALFTSR